MKILPSRLSAKQRTQVKLTKLRQSTGKTAIKELGNTVRSGISAIATNRTLQAKIAADAESKRSQNTKNNDDSLNKAIAIYEEVIKGNPSSTGSTGTESTTEVGSSGSKLGG